MFVCNWRRHGLLTPIEPTSRTYHLAFHTFPQMTRQFIQYFCIVCNDYKMKTLKMTLGINFEMWDRE